MKLFFSLLLASLILSGASCGRVQPPAEDVTVTTGSPASARSDRDEYIANVEAKMQDLLRHIDQLEQKRSEISSEQQPAFDEQIVLLRGEYSRLQTVFQALKDAPETAFMQQRTLVNEQLQKTEDLYLKIITDYELEVGV